MVGQEKRCAVWAHLSAGQPIPADHSLFDRHARRIGTTWPSIVGASQNFAHASASWRRFSNRSPRRYAASTLSLTIWAIAISATSLAKFVRSAAQSRNELLKP